MKKTTIAITYDSLYQLQAMRQVLKQLSYDDLINKLVEKMTPVQKDKVKILTQYNRWKK